MAYPTIEMHGRTIILLDDFESSGGSVVATAWTPETLREIGEVARRYPDAVAFGHVAGHWLPAA